MAGAEFIIGAEFIGMATGGTIVFIGVTTWLSALMIGGMGTEFIGVSTIEGTLTDGATTSP